MRILSFFTLFQLLFSVQSQAVINGTPAVAPNALCSLTFFDGDRMDDGNGNCTGTLIDRKTILTAGHCVLEMTKNLKLKATVSCGFKGTTPHFTTETFSFSANADFITNNPQAVETRIFNTDFDLAKLHLNKSAPASIIPIEIASAEEYKNFLNHPESLNCFIGGAGKNELMQFDPRTPFLREFNSVHPLEENKDQTHTTPVSFSVHYEAALSLSEWKRLISLKFSGLPAGYADTRPEAEFHVDDFLFKTKAQWTAYNSILNAHFPKTAFQTEGDSGGSFLCQKKDDSKHILKIYGVVSSVSYKVPSPLGYQTELASDSSQMPVFKAKLFWSLPSIPLEKIR